MTRMKNSKQLNYFLNVILLVFLSFLNLYQIYLKKFKFISHYTELNLKIQILWDTLYLIIHNIVKIWIILELKKPLRWRKIWKFVLHHFTCRIKYCSECINFKETIHYSVKLLGILETSLLSILKRILIIGKNHQRNKNDKTYHKRDFHELDFNYNFHEFTHDRLNKSSKNVYYFWVNYIILKIFRFLDVIN